MAAFFVLVTATTVCAGQATSHIKYEVGLDVAARGAFDAHSQAAAAYPITLRAGIMGRRRFDAEERVTLFDRARTGARTVRPRFGTFFDWRLGDVSGGSNSATYVGVGVSTTVAEFENGASVRVFGANAGIGTRVGFLGAVIRPEVGAGYDWRARAPRVNAFSASRINLDIRLGLSRIL